MFGHVSESQSSGSSAITFRLLALRPEGIASGNRPAEIQSRQRARFADYEAIPKNILAAYESPRS